MDELGPATRGLDTGGEVAEGIPPGDGLPLRFLLAEDGKVNQVVATQLLRKYGHEVVVVENGRDALETYRPSDFDAVLMDVQMPGMNGLEATRAIRKKEQAENWERVPIVAMTANAMQGDREECLEAGMDDYLAKPIRPAEFLEVIAGIRQPANTNDSDSSLEGGSEPETEGATAVDSSKVFDAQAFQETMGNDDLMRTLIEEFHRESRAVLERMDAALSQKDAASLHEATHSLKGLVGTFSAEAAHHRAIEIDNAARGGDLENARGLASEVKREVELLKKALDQFAGTLGEQ
jgi:protein-histidine pros-kinase